MWMNRPLRFYRRLAIVILAGLGPLLLLVGWFVIPSASRIGLGVYNTSHARFEQVSVRLCDTTCDFGALEPGEVRDCTVEPLADSPVMLKYTSPTGERREVEMTTRVKRGMYGSISVMLEDTGVSDGSYLSEWWLP